MKIKKAAFALLAAVLLTGCAGGQKEQDNAYIDLTPMGQTNEIAQEAVSLSGAPAPAIPDILKPEAPGVLTEENGRAVIDYSNTADGYVMVRCGAAGKRLKVQVEGPSAAERGTPYTYNLPADEWTTFPLSDGSGSYRVTVFENVQDNRYATLLSAAFDAALTDEFAPFIRPNQYVDYENAVNTVAKAAELTAGVDDPLQKVEKIYNFVVNTLTYDHELAETVQSGYLPVLDEVLEKEKGICFDYASLMTGMLRSQGVPCKLVVGYAGEQYHAWINVWTQETGWVDGAVFFDGVNWQRMDPTFVSSGKNSDAVQQYVGDGSHYNALYLY